MNESNNIVRASHLAEAFSSLRGKTFLLYGNELIFPLTMHIAAYMMLKQRNIAVVDGCNRVNVHALARFAQERNIDPESFLKTIFISRGFTCYQIEQAVMIKLPDFLKKIHSRNAIILGLLDTLYDEQAPLREVRQILNRLLATFEKFKEEGITLLVTCQKFNIVPEERNRLFPVLLNSADNVYRLTTDNNSPRLLLEKGDLHGKVGSNVYKPHRRTDRVLVEVPAGSEERRPGSL